MSKTEVSGKQLKDGSVELVDLASEVSDVLNTLQSDVATLQTDVAAKADAGNLASVATSGSYNDLSDKPSIPSVAGLASETYVDTAVAGVVNSAPAVLDTLKELSDALAGDASFATTVAGQIGAVAADVSALDGRVTSVEADITALQGASAPNLSDLGEVSITTPSSGQVLKYDGLGWVNAADSTFSGVYADLTGKPTLFDGAYSSLTGSPTLATVSTSGSYADLTNKPSIPSALDDLSDVTISSPSNTQVLQYNGSGWVNATASVGATSLDGLSDVAITSAAKGQFIVHNGTSFVNSNTIEASGAAVKPLIVKAAASQTANLFEAQNSASTALFSVNNNGTVAQLTAGSGSSAYFQVTANYAWVRLGRAYLQFGNYTGAYISAGDDGVPFTIRMGASADAEAMRVEGKTAGSTAAPRVGFGETTLGAGTGQVNIKTPDATRKALIVKGAASQSANLIETQNSSGVALTVVQSDGTLHAKRYTETVANAFNTSLAPSTGTLTVDSSLGNAVLGALSASVTTWAFTNVSTDNSKVTTISAILAGNTLYTYGDACSVNGSAVTDGIMWSGGSAPTATAGTDIITFVIVKDSAGTVKVFGSATTNFS